ncbi:MAG: hypothetical protein ABSF83_04275 [Nitrososphaerales archaeon]
MMARRIVPVAIGAILVLLGVLEFLSMKPSVLNDTLRNADAMGVGLGVQLFAGLALIAYGTVVVGTPAHPAQLKS